MSVVGTGLADITVLDIMGAIISQHELIVAVDAANGINYDQLYVHRCRAYGTADGYLSIAPYSHRFNYVRAGSGATTNNLLWNSYESAENSTYRRGSLTQMYEFGINGATRPELVWDWPETEVLNSPLISSRMALFDGTETRGNPINPDYLKLLTVQSTNTGGDALYIVQFDVTLRNSRFIELTSTLGAAAFGEKNVVTDNYKPPTDLKKKNEEGKKAQELANKKRKVENVKALTMPALDAH